MTIFLQKSIGNNNLVSHDQNIDDTNSLLEFGFVDQVIIEPPLGRYIPVTPLHGRVASIALEKLHDLMMIDDPKAGIIGILGGKGVGKTVLLKHLHNRLLERVHDFDHLLWVTCPVNFSVTGVQDSIANAVNCDISQISDMSLRAEKLCGVLTCLGRVAIFLDGVSEIFILEEVGIPDPSKGSKCKVVFTTSLNTVCETLGCDDERVVKLEQLTEDDALELFMSESGIATLMPGSLIHDVARLIVKECCGLPSEIVEVANRLYGIFDIREWRNTLFELQNAHI